MIAPPLEPLFPGAVALLKQKYARDYCLHGCPLPLSKKAAAFHAKEAARLTEEARKLLERAARLRCGRRKK